MRYFLLLRSIINFSHAWNFFFWQILNLFIYLFFTGNWLFIEWRCYIFIRQLLRVGQLICTKIHLTSFVSADRLPIIIINAERVSECEKVRRKKLIDSCQLVATSSTHHHHRIHTGSSYFMRNVCAFSNY